MLEHILEAANELRGDALDTGTAHAKEARAALEGVRSAATVQSLQSNLLGALRPCRHLAALLLDWWGRQEAQPAAALEAAQAAAARSCAYLRCANLGGEGGPAAGQGAGSQRCR